MYRKKKNPNSKKITAIGLIFICLISFGFVNFGSFWTPPNYYEDGTAESRLEASARYGGDWIEYSQKWDGSFYYVYYLDKDS